MHIRFLSVCTLLSMSAPFAMADDQAESQPQLPTVVVLGQANVESATTQAPTQTPLDVTQPTQLINQHFIENNLPPSSNFPEIVAISPSVQAVSPNGPGLMENQILSIRGFVDGDYNVTFDGIPFNDSNDFTHHSTSYFMANDLGGVEVDYGPGTAATIGNATFCCTIDNRSKDPQATTTFTPSVSFGSFNTSVVGAEFDTGRIDRYNGASGFIDAQSLSSDGELSYMSQSRKNLFAKAVLPVTDGTQLAFVAMYNQVHQGVGLGATAAQIAEFGPTYGLNANPDSQDYYGYNFDDIHTDFEYIGLHSTFSNWTIDNKVYTYAYYHNGHNGEDPNGETPNGTSYGADDVPGELLTNNYRSWGDTFKIKGNFFFGDIQTGVWGDRQSNERALVEVDETLGGAINVGSPFASAPSGYDRLLTQTLYTLQPFVQLDWNALPGLTISPGVRYDHFERSVDAAVNVKDAAAESYADIFSATLPSVLAHYTIADGWAAYAQAAKGFLAPNENYYDIGEPGNVTLKPQETWSYQTGTTWQTKRLSVSADVYLIDFNNEIQSETSGDYTVYYNEGGTKYKGVEASATFYIGMGLSVYANGSVNSAKDNSTGLWVPNAPDGTAAAGLIYNLNGWYASLLEKWVGRTYGDVGQTQPIGSYGLLNGALGYTFSSGPWWLRRTSLKLDFSNLLNNTRIFALAGYTVAAGTPLYWTIPERSVFGTITMPL